MNPQITQIAQIRRTSRKSSVSFSYLRNLRVFTVGKSDREEVVYESADCAD